ncbi:CRISPR-Cas associated transcriptional regulator,contains CARF and HTH domain [Halapricum desulfuricans]|uniref:CRISPR-Cas associated transcriptional regulator,contains CARF and HTH domain n=1 Tax=Halapricum desulfuricans TaxID=2841257 RepID=A0A897NGC2_9EURY|nr:CRISPR-associated CARF protein Csa3 [Halapricum desulfuricans]QSG11484.1 CRISPR-Cas associated transcriptional regulator,contains CARF and HTH domain [Halapricum desulfuricans]
MRTYISPIGYDTRRVTRPVVTTGLSADDTVVMIRPDEESDTERANRAIADVESLLQEIEAAADHTIERVSTEGFEKTVRECCAILESVPDESETIVSLGGGARDILLPLTIASLVFSHRVDQALFFSDIDQDVRPLSLPELTARVPERTQETFESIVTGDGWQTLTGIADGTGQSKSTVIRHVNALEEAEVVEADTSEKAKQVRVSFSGELLSKAWSLQT